jgi:hypothetical protein
MRRALQSTRRARLRRRLERQTASLVASSRSAIEPVLVIVVLTIAARRGRTRESIG